MGPAIIVASTARDLQLVPGMLQSTAPQARAVASSAHKAAMSLQSASTPVL
jgi:hypothetical protein